MGPGVVDSRPARAALRAQQLLRSRRHGPGSGRFRARWDAPEAAATIPVCFVTVYYYSLVQFAQLSPGETVLVHGGPGRRACGVADRTFAQRARSLATSGHSDKRALLRDLGPRRSSTRRNLSFADQIMRHTKGRASTLCSIPLAGDAMERSVRCLAVQPFHRARQDGFRFEHAAQAASFSHNLSYFGVDADQLLTGRPKSPERYSAVTQLLRRAARGAALRGFTTARIL